MGLDKLQENAVVRIIDDDDSMRKSWSELLMRFGLKSQFIF